MGTGMDAGMTADIMKDIGTGMTADTMRDMGTGMTADTMRDMGTGMTADTMRDMGTGMTVGTATVTDTMEAQIFRRIMDFSFPQMDRFGTGSLVTRVTNDIPQHLNGILMLVMLSHINLRIHRGETVAVIGATGCGKTTLA